MPCKQLSNLGHWALVIASWRFLRTVDYFHYCTWSSCIISVFWQLCCSRSDVFLLLIPSQRRVAVRQMLLIFELLIFDKLALVVFGDLECWCVSDSFCRSFLYEWHELKTELPKVCLKNSEKLILDFCCLSLLGLVISTHAIYIFMFLQVVKIKAISNH